LKETKTIFIEFDNFIFRLNKSIDGKLTINKISVDGTDDSMKISPRSGNEIEVY